MNRLDEEKENISNNRSRKMKCVINYSRAVLAALFVVIIPFMTACTTPSETTATASPPGIGNFSIQILDFDQTLPGTEVKVQVYTLDLNREVGISQSILYYYDVTPPTMAGQSAKSAPGTFLEASLDGGPDEYLVTWNNVAAGKHTFSAQLVNPDYTPLNPPVIAQTIIDVPSEIMNKIPALQQLTIQTDYDFILIGASAYDFRINDDTIGKANNPGEGHFIYYLDVEPPTNQGQPATTATGTYKVSASSVSWKGIPPGEHTVSVQLVNNDNTPLSPVVTSQTTVELIPLQQP
jgi:hypothetical protein